VSGGPKDQNLWFESGHRSSPTRGERRPEKREMIIGKATIVVLAAASVCSSSAFTAAPSIRPVSTTLGLGKLAVAAASSNRIYDSKKAAAEEMKAPDPSSGVDAEIKKAMGKKQATDCRYSGCLPLCHRCT
jgi:hypothetical protein